MAEEINLSVVILCYRSGESIIQFANNTQERIKNLTSSYEIILVGNYFEDSGDNTKEVVEGIAAKDHHFKAVCYPKKGMMGWDMKSGMDRAVGQYICVIDGDGQFPIESLDLCYKEIIKGEYDLVKTYRISRGDGIYRKTISKVYNFLFTLLFPGLNAKDINSKPKIFTKKAYKEFNLTSDDWFIDAEIMIRARRLKLKIKDFPVEFLKLENRQSFVKFGAILEFVKNLIIFRIKEFRSGS
jgi:glycosyltransferase involved in cell wall biosynthesis